jgi:hypothetical protein
MSAGVRILPCILLYCLTCAPVFAQYEPDSPSDLWARALVDFRLAHGGPAPAYTDRGFGKLRYGGTADMERSTHLGLSQLALQLGAVLPWDIRAQVQLNVQPDIAAGYQPWVIEAVLRREWGEPRLGWAVQSGVMNAPFSLENGGPAWSPEMTVSDSALNSWIWEDINLAGVESEIWARTGAGLRLGALVGAGYGGDQIGRLLALRGWVMGDTLGGINGDLALPGRSERTDIFNEQDHRPALYAWLSLGDAQKVGALKFGYLDNRGDESRTGVWHTHFSVSGFELHPGAQLDVTVQYLEGVARVRSPPNDSAVSAYYGLVSWHFRAHRVSFRYDAFRVHDLDGGPSTSERGHALTAAYLLQIGLRSRIALEHIWMNSHRAGAGSLNPSPDGWQISYRFRY